MTATPAPAAARDDAAAAPDARPKAAPPADKQAPDSVHGISTQGFHPALIPAIPPPAAFKASPHAPIVVTRNPFACAQNVSIEGHSGLDRHVNGINTFAMEIDSDIAVGRIEVHVRGLKSSQPERFAGKKRVSIVGAQVRFKKPVAAADLCIGQEMFSELTVPVWLSEALLTLAAKTLSSTTRVSARSEPRYFMNPVLAACQLINVARPGEEPGMWEAAEDARLMLPGAAGAGGAPLGADERRKWCDVPANIAGAVFSPDYVYTFHCWQHYVNLSSYELAIGPLRVDCAPVMHRSPMQITVKDVGTGAYAFSVMLWHERALYGARAGAGGIDAGKAAALGRLVNGVRGLLSRS